MLTLYEATDWHKWGFNEYLIVSGLAVTVLALLLYFIPGARIKVPAIITCGLGCLAAGFGAGMLTLVTMGYQKESQQNGQRDAALSTNGAAKQGMGKISPAMPGGGKKGGGKGGGRGPSPKTQLVDLVNKIDVLTAKPLSIQLTGPERAKLMELLKGIDQPQELTDEEAKSKLDALVEQMKPHKETLEAAGYRWPGEGGGRGPTPPPNPFKEPKESKRLQVLQDRLANGKPQ